MNYNLFSYIDSVTNKKKHLVVPLRTGSSFTKDIINNFAPSDRSNLEIVNHDIFPGAISGTEMGFQHLTLPHSVDLNIVYRHPVTRYASALPMLLGGLWDEFLDWMGSGVDLHAGSRDSIIAEGFVRIMKMPVESLLRDGIHQPFEHYMLARKLDSAMATHPFDVSNVMWDPTFGESHCRPVMLTTAVLACLSEQPQFTELEDYTAWAEREILAETISFPTSRRVMADSWHNGRSSLPKGSSAVHNESPQFCMDYLAENYRDAFGHRDNYEVFPLTFNEYIAPDVATYEYIYSQDGHFASRETLIDFLVEVFGKYPYAITRNMYLLKWVSNEYMLEKLPPRLALAIRENIKAGLQQLNDHTYYRAVDFLGHGS